MMRSGSIYSGNLSSLYIRFCMHLYMYIYLAVVNPIDTLSLIDIFRLSCTVQLIILLSAAYFGSPQ